MLPLFIQYLTSEKRSSKHTVQAYKTDLEQCAVYLHLLSLNSKLEKASQQVLRMWIVSLTQQGLSNRSVNRKIASLKAFYRFLHKKAYIKQNPTLKLSALKIKKSLPAFIKERELLRLLDHHAFEDTFEGWRDKLVLELLYGTGIRLAELLNLRDKDVDLYDNTIRVLGKRNKERIIPFPKSLRQVIERYQEIRTAMLSSPQDGLLLITAPGKPCYPMLIYRLIKKYLCTYTNVDKCSPHVLRHTFATHLLNKGADLNAIKDLLGHESLAATQLYTHHSLKALKEAFKQAHPRA